MKISVANVVKGGSIDYTPVDISNALFLRFDFSEDTGIQNDHIDVHVYGTLPGTLVVSGSNSVNIAPEASNKINVSNIIPV